MSDSNYSTDPPQDFSWIRAAIADLASNIKVPVSTYRLQLNHSFTFYEAKKWVTYLDELGVEGVYLSPFLQAVPGSPHGYNTTDPTKVNEELGGEEGFGEFSEEVSRHGQMVIQDIVPNHMGNHFTNRLWMDVLEHGKASKYAPFFDIDWNSEKSDMREKVLIPILGDQFGNTLENQEICLSYENSQMEVNYWDHRFPVAPETYAFVLEQNLSRLEEAMGVDHPDVMELESIITAFHHLPERGYLTPESEQERYRESEITKHRLDHLQERSAAIRNYLHDQIALFNGIKGEVSSFDLLEEFLYMQPYRLASWRVASEEINYRRFFDVNELVAIRMEEPQVFDFYHHKIFEFLQADRVHALRIDHTDGLYDPPGYFLQLQKAYLRFQLLEMAKQKGLEETNLLKEAVDRQIQALEEIPRVIYVIIEKILERKENLPESWNVSGTVGYEFLNLMDGLFVHRDSQEYLDLFYKRFTGMKVDYEELLYNQKKKFIRLQMPGEVNMLGRRLKDISNRNRRYRDFTLNVLIKALTEVIACFPVYRTYVGPDTVVPSERDLHYIHIAIQKASVKNHLLSPSVFDFIEDVLSLKLKKITAAEQELFLDFVLRFQQISSPIMAKGMEDTTFYIQNRLVSLNEVGGDPEYFGYSPKEFHRQNLERQKLWPSNMLPSSTHDTKRSEDVRLRISTITEVPQTWRKLVLRWNRINKKFKLEIDGRLFPDQNTEYLIYQTLVGIWPDYPIEDDYWPVFRERVWTYFKKAVREAKIHTGWVHVNQEYEDSVKGFIYQILDPKKNRYFFASFMEFQKKAGYYGKLGALSRMVLKHGSPGIPDTYQGNELWDYSLVDPDNRRPIDFDLRRHLLYKVRDLHSTEVGWQEKARDLLENLRDSRMKIFILWRLLQTRRENKRLFFQGDYIPLEVNGPLDNHVVAYLRRHEDQWILFAAGRFFWEMENQSKLPVSSAPWEETYLEIPSDCQVETWESIFWTDQRPGSTDGKLPLDELFEIWPYFVGMGVSK